MYDITINTTELECLNHPVNNDDDKSVYFDTEHSDSEHSVAPNPKLSNVISSNPPEPSATALESDSNSEPPELSATVPGPQSLRTLKRTKRSPKINSPYEEATKKQLGTQNRQVSTEHTANTAELTYEDTQTEKGQCYY